MMLLQIKNIANGNLLGKGFYGDSISVGSAAKYGKLCVIKVFADIYL